MRAAAAANCFMVTSPALLFVALSLLAPPAPAAGPSDAGLKPSEVAAVDMSLVTQPVASATDSMSTAKDLPDFAAAPLSTPAMGELPVAQQPTEVAEISPVPEPSSLVLGAWGLAVTGYLLRRRQLRRERRRQPPA